MVRKSLLQALPAQTLSLSDVVIKTASQVTQGQTEVTQVQKEFKPISDASVTVFIEEEKSQNASKLDRMAPDEPISYRLSIDKKSLPAIPNDTNTRRHLRPVFNANVIALSANQIRPERNRVLANQSAI